MNFTALLDVAIGLVLVYVGASLLVTMLNEYLTEFVFKLGRRDYLAKALVKLLDLDALARIAKDADNVRLKRVVAELEDVQASYVDTKYMAQSLLTALVAPDPNGAPVTLEQVRTEVEKLPESAIKQTLSTLVQVPDTLSAAVDSIGDWAERRLTALGETYKRHMQWVSFGLGLFVAVAANIQTLYVVERLYLDKELRDQMAVAAEQYVEQAKPELLEKCPQVLAEKSLADAPAADVAECQPVQHLVQAMIGRDQTFGQLPVGWRVKSGGELLNELVSPRNLLGWLLTALALSLGAPFWFDLLSRLVNVRATMKRPPPPNRDSASASAAE